jgi:hypothetical protein
MYKKKIVLNRPNINMVIKNQTGTADDLQWYVDELVNQGEDAPKALIFCR